MSEWKSTKKHPIIIKQMSKLKNLVDALPVKIRETKEEVRKLKR